MKVQHATIKGAIMRVSECNAGGWTRKAARTTQTRDDGWHLILEANTQKLTYRLTTSRTKLRKNAHVCVAYCCTCKGRTAFTVTVDVS